MQTCIPVPLGLTFWYSGSGPLTKSIMRSVDVTFFKSHLFHVGRCAEAWGRVALKMLGSFLGAK